MSDNVDRQVRETTLCPNALQQKLTMRTDTHEKAKLSSLLAAILAVRGQLVNDQGAATRVVGRTNSDLRQNRMSGSWTSPGQAPSSPRPTRERQSHYQCRFLCMKTCRRNTFSIWRYRPPILRMSFGERAVSNSKSRCCKIRASVRNLKATATTSTAVSNIPIPESAFVIC